MVKVVSVPVLVEIIGSCGTRDKTQEFFDFRLGLLASWPNGVPIPARYFNKNARAAAPDPVLVKWRTGRDVLGRCPARHFLNSLTLIK